MAGAADRARRRSAGALAGSRVRGSGVIRSSRRVRSDGRLSRVATDGGRRVRASASAGWQAVSLAATGADFGASMGARWLVAAEREERDAPGALLRRSGARAPGERVFAPTAALRAPG